MAKLATLIDDFQDGVIDAAEWTTAGTVTESGGRVHVTPTITYSSLTALATYDMVESGVVAQIAVTTANGSTGTLESTLIIQKDGNNRAGLRKQSSNIQCVKVVAGVFTTVYTFPYNSATHIFWRMRESGGIFYWDVSATGTSWSNLFNTTVATNLFPVNNVAVALYSGWASGSEAFPGTFQIEAVNPGLAFISAGASTSTGSLAFLLSTPGEFVSSGASTSTGSLDFTLVLPGTIDFAASGASISSGNLDATLLSAGTLAFVASATSTSIGFLIFSLGAAVDEEDLYEDYYYFEPPIVYDLPPTLPDPRPRYINAHARWKGGQRRGRSVLKLDGAYVTIDTPTVDQTLAATELYQGGHVYTVEKSIANALSAAGYTVIPIPFNWTVYPDDGLYPANSLYPGFSDVVLEETPPPPPEPPILLPSPYLLPSPVLVP